MAITTYMDLIDQMKALADKINNHYDSVTLETEVPIEDETSRILREAGIIEDEDDSKEESEQIEEFVAAMPAITSATKAAARQNSYTPADDEEDEDLEDKEVDEAVEKPTDSAMTDLRHMLNRLARK